MGHDSAGHKRSRTPQPKKTVAIRLSAHPPAKGTAPAQNWHHAMSHRTKVMFRRVVIAAAVTAPLLAARAKADEPLRPVRVVTVQSAAQRDLTRLLDRVKQNKNLVDARAKARRISAGDAAQLRKDLASVEKRAKALTRKSRAHMERGLRSLDMELDEIGQKIRT
jgi:flagellar motility protein MotE (MotC chaperone)